MAQEMSVVTRLQSETPKFFKKLINYAAGLGGAAIAFLTAVKAIPNFTVPAIWETIASYAIAISAAAVAVSKLTMTDTPAPVAEVTQAVETAKAVVADAAEQAKAEVENVKPVE